MTATRRKVSITFCLGVLKSGSFLPNSPSFPTVYVNCETSTFYVNKWVCFMTTNNKTQNNLAVESQQHQKAKKTVTGWERMGNSYPISLYYRKIYKSPTLGPLLNPIFPRQMTE